MKSTPGAPSVDARRRRVRQRPGERRRERVRPTRAARDEAPRASEATAQPRPRRDPPHELRLGLIERSPLHVRARLHVRHLEALVLRVGIEERRNRTRVVAVVVRATGVPIGQLRVRRLRGHALGDGAKIGKSPNQNPQTQRLRRESPGDPAPYTPQTPPELEREQRAQRNTNHVERGQIQRPAHVLQTKSAHQPAVQSRVGVAVNKTRSQSVCPYTSNYNYGNRNTLTKTELAPTPGKRSSPPGTPRAPCDWRTPRPSRRGGRRAPAGRSRRSTAAGTTRTRRGIWRRRRARGRGRYL